MPDKSIDSEQEPEDRRPDLVAEAVGLHASQVEEALAYWAEHRQEIDAQVRRDQDAAREALAAWQRQQDLRAV